MRHCMVCAEDMARGVTAHSYHWRLYDVVQQPAHLNGLGGSVGETLPFSCWVPVGPPLAEAQGSYRYSLDDPGGGSDEEAKLSVLREAERLGYGLVIFSGWSVGVERITRVYDALLEITSGNRPERGREETP